MEKKKRSKFFAVLMIIIIVAVIGYGGFLIYSTEYDKQEAEFVNVQLSDVRTGTSEVSGTSTQTTTSLSTTAETTTTTATSITVVRPVKTEDSQRFPNEYDADFAVLINADRNEVVAYKNANSKMYPASLTKIMTLIIAVENIEDLNDRVKITDDMVFPMIELDASRAGFLPDETPKLRDVLYGLVLCSGADSAMAVSEYVAGSEEAFVEMMNAKAEELGLDGTHFANAVGLHDKENYSTVTDMALILEYAIQNDICRKIISAYEYKVPPTEQNPEGLTFTSNFFSRMYGDEMPDVTIKGGKTGYTDKSGNCIESYAEINGETYILVLCKCSNKWNAIYDTLSLYSVYGAGGEKYISSSSKR
ncbi:MAG: serine hydrolase [Ruminococcus sp.]|nr:serine hydrolase [Ruminococcus sp.]